MISKFKTPIFIFIGIALYYCILYFLRDVSFYPQIAQVFTSLSQFYFVASLPFFAVANVLYLIILILGFLNAKKQSFEEKTHVSHRLSPLKSLKPISILVPCYNEELSVFSSVSSMLRLDYPEFEVVVCNDGSKDKTIDILLESFQLEPLTNWPPHSLPCNKIRAVYKSKLYKNLIVIDKENGGKADALNAALNFSQFPLICCVDSDSILDSKGLLAVALPFFEDESMIATGGSVLVANTSGEVNSRSLTSVNMEVNSSWFGTIQAVEYLRAFFVGRLGWDYIHCNPIISGAFGLFKKSVVIRVGGYATGTIGEDMELIVRMQAYCLRENIKFKVRYMPIPACWTEPPSDLKTLGNQRIRWTQGLAECLWLHKKILFRRWSGVLGNVGLPYFLFFELLAGPIEIFGYWVSVTGLGLNIFDWRIVCLFLIMTVLYGYLLSLGAIVIDQLTFRKYKKFRDVYLLALGAVYEHFGFRQLHLGWRIKGIYRWIMKKQSWGEMKRVGVSKIKLR